MRSKTIFGALLVSVALCSQGFGFELLDRMLGLNCGGCGEYKACAKVACCEPAVKACCPEPVSCEKACYEPTCCNRKKCRITPVRDLFAGLIDLFECKGVQCDPYGCEAVEEGCGPEPACCPEPAYCEEPACEPVCQPKCHKLYRRPILELLEALFGGRDCCGQAYCEAGCETACGAAPATNATTPTTAPEEAAPLPMAPKADPSAAIPSRGIYQAARSLVRN